MKKTIQKIQAFTLIELIVVIAIIAILATSGTLMLTKRFSSARDSSRKQAVSQISTALDVSMTSRTSFPTPESSTEVYDVSGALVWYQGTFGSSIADIITAIDSAPQDPSTNEYYGYSISSDKKKYQLKAELENEDTIAYLNRAYAASNENKIAYVDGNYNGYILTYTGGKYYLYQLPSIFMKNSGLEAGSKVGSGTLPLVNPGSKFSTDVEVKVADITAVVNSTDEDGSVADTAATLLGIDVNLISKVIKSAAGGEGVSVSSTSTSTGDEGGDTGGDTVPGADKTYVGVSLFQTMPTPRSTDTTFFEIDGTYYVTFNDIVNYDLEIYEYDANTDSFVSVQNIAGDSTIKNEFFQMGSDYYMAFCENGQPGDATTDRVMKWNGTQFVAWKTLPASTSFDLKHFEYNNEHYIVTSEAVYHWNDTTQEFESVQSLGFGTRDLDIFTMNSDIYVVESRYTTNDPNSKLYKWDGTQFVQTQGLDQTNTTRGSDYFTIGDQHYLAVAGYGSNNVAIYHWDGSQFVSSSSISTTGPRDELGFSIGSETFLISANLTSVSKMYKWNGSSFDELTTVMNVNGGADVEMMWLGTDRMFVSISNYYESPKIYEIDVQ